MVIPPTKPGAASPDAATVEEYPLRSINPDVPDNESPVERMIYRSSLLDDRGLNRLICESAFAVLTIYRPTPEKNNGVALVACPGGGYGMIVIDREGHWIARHFQNLGFTVVVLKYRLPRPEITGDALPLSQQDALETLRQVRLHAPGWDVNQVGIIGSSAGGHLAASTAVFGRMADGTRPDFVVLLYPVVCLEPPFAHWGSGRALLGPGASPERVAEYSLERRARPGLPPFFIVHAKDDKIVPVENSRLLAGALRGASVPVTLIEYDTGGHGFSLELSPGHETGGWKDEFVKWLAAFRSSR
jgi:acetyl esterase/lipase